MTCFAESGVVCVTVFVGVVSAVSEAMFYDVLLSFTHFICIHLRPLLWVLSCVRLGFLSDSTQPSSRLFKKGSNGHSMQIFGEIPSIKPQNDT